MAPGVHLEESGDLIRKDTFSPHPGAEPRVVEAPATQRAQPREHLALAIGVMALEPVLEEGRDGVRQPHHDEGRPLRARVRGGLEDARNLVVGQARDHGRHHHVHRNPGPRKAIHGTEPLIGRGCARLHRALEGAIERGDRDADGRCLVARELGEQIDIARHQCVLGDDPDRVAALCQHGEATARDLEVALDRLIRIGHAGEGEHLGLPALRGELTTENRRRLLLHHDARLEVEPRREAEVLVARARVTVDTTVCTTAIRVDTGIERNVRAAVAGDQAPGGISEIEGARAARRPRLTVLVGIGESKRLPVDLVRQPLEAIRRVLGSAPTTQRRSRRAPFVVESIRVLAAKPRGRVARKALAGGGHGAKVKRKYVALSTRSGGLSRGGFVHHAVDVALVESRREDPEGEHEVVRSEHPAPYELGVPVLEHQVGEDVEGQGADDDQQEDLLGIQLLSEPPPTRSGPRHLFDGGRRYGGRRVPVPKPHHERGEKQRAEDERPREQPERHVDGLRVQVDHDADADRDRKDAEDGARDCYRQAHGALRLGHGTASAWIRQTIDRSPLFVERRLSRQRLRRRSALCPNRDAQIRPAASTRLPGTPSPGTAPLTNPASPTAESFRSKPSV